MKTTIKKKGETTTNLNNKIITNFCHVWSDFEIKKKLFFSLILKILENEIRSANLCGLKVLCQMPHK